MGTNLNQAFNKLLFCFRICADMKSFLNLVKNTRRFSRYYRSDPNRHQGGPNDEICYNLALPTGKRNIYLRTMRGDITMFYELFWQKVYFLEMPEKSTRLTIVDAGAHIGMSTLFFLEHYETAMVYSIEPDTANLTLLRKNLSDYISRRRVTVIDCAISGQEGSGLLGHSGWSYNSRLKGTGPSSIPEANKTELTEKQKLLIDEDNDEVVQTKTIQCIIIENNIEHIDLLKIDIEGAESVLFAGDTDWLNKVDNILIEIHSEDLKDPITRILIGHGFGFEKWNRNPHGDVYLARKSKY
jgi:FkbM family methyltransferase